ncbi:ATP-binding protein [Hahella sp. SMD15-11]|uniref:histidine kinase n=1 Tax=Thermohahella caldifontis TaxID=3142973 RepID=A0AB39UUP6_9GAMM
MPELRWPRSLRARLVIMLLLTLLAAQGLSIWIWQRQARQAHDETVISLGRQLAYSIASTVRFFGQLPRDYRHIVLDQLRRMGGSRFFVTLNNEHIEVTPIPDSAIKRRISAAVREVLVSELGSQLRPEVEFAFAEDLRVFNNNTRLLELPPGWGHHSLLLKPRSSPIMVVQMGLKDDQWLYLATVLPTPDGALEAEPLSPAQLWSIGASTIAVLVVALLWVRGLTRPLRRLARAAEMLGREKSHPLLPETGSTELAALARAFNLMQTRIRGYIRDREQMFSAISHDLKTPITRLRLRAEMIGDDTQRDKFIADLEELELLVNGALRAVKETALNESASWVDLDAFLEQIAGQYTLRNRSLMTYTCAIRGKAELHTKPLALRRALTNLIDNGIKYGGRVDVRLMADRAHFIIQVRDFGPGIPEKDLDRVTEPFVRLEGSRNRNTGGTGLGLSIVKSIVNALGGELRLRNHHAGGLVVDVLFSRQPAR